MYGKNNMFDESEETCWNSDSRDHVQGGTQYIICWFEKASRMDSICIMMQGGFASQIIEVVAEEERNSFSLHDCSVLQTIDTAFENVTKVKLLFPSPTDFFGRIIVYSLSFYGEPME